MEIGIGLPNSVPGVSGPIILDWARAAERRGFSTLGTIDRIVYPNYEPFTTLAAVAAITTRIRLTTSIVISPLHSNVALLGKQAATLDQLSGGRLVLGFGVGARPDDYAVSGLDMSERGSRLETQLKELDQIWNADTADGIGPAPAQAGGPPVVLAGHAPPALARAGRQTHGWICGVMGPEAFRQGSEMVREAWTAAGRTGSPRMLALAYYALGDNAEHDTDTCLRDYYAGTGPFMDAVLANAAASEATVKSMTAEYEAAGCDEVIWMPCSTDVAQVDMLADTVGLR